MNILVCVKRVPITGAKIPLTRDEQAIDTAMMGWTISPHEECGVEEAVRLIEAQGGESTVLILGPAEAEEQLRDAMALGVDRAILLETDGREWDAIATAHAMAEAIRGSGTDYDILFFGNEAADTGDYQVGIRVAYALDLPCVTGIKRLEIGDGVTIAQREVPGGWEKFEVALPAVITVREGLNLPRYPSLPGRLKAKKKPVERIAPEWSSGDGALMEKVRLKLPRERGSGVQVLGKGAQAAPRVVELLKELGLV